MERWREGAGGEGAEQAREAAGLNAVFPARCPALLKPIPMRHLLRPSAPRERPPGRRVGTSLSSHLSSLLFGTHVGGAARGCAWQGPRQRVLCVGWGSRQGGLTLPAPGRRCAAPGSIVCAT